MTPQSHYWGVYLEETRIERDTWRHRLSGRECERAPGAGGGQGGLACCRPWGRKESDTTEQQQ